MTNNNKKLGELGEVSVIQLVEELILERTGRELLRDDSFYFDIPQRRNEEDGEPLSLCLNADMLVSTTDVPKQMNYRQMGHKAVIMNISDLVVKGVQPHGIVISFGLPSSLNVVKFRSMVNGIIDACLQFDMKYIGGDVNEAKEIIVNPTVFGFQSRDFILYRKGVKIGDILVANGKFGLTGVGFDILLNKIKEGGETLQNYKAYKNSINSVLNPQIGLEGIHLAKHRLAHASIDSSDGLIKSLQELRRSNHGIGFEVELNKALIHGEAIRYSKEFEVPIENLLFLGGGEEFIHLFLMNEGDYQSAQKLVASREGRLFKIGEVVAEEGIYGLREGKRIRLEGRGYEHFT